MYNLIVNQNDFCLILIKASIYFTFFSGRSEVQCCVADDLSQVINKNIAMLEGRFGVLLFLYSILLTKVR